MPVAMEISYDFRMSEVLLDYLQTHFEEMTMTAWKQAVTGQSPFGVGVKDSRYRNELDTEEILYRTRDFSSRTSIFRGGEIAKIYEEGVQPYDLKIGLLNGLNAKETKDGERYNTVPFRHGAPGEQETKHFQTMKSDIYDMVRPKYKGPGGVWNKSKSFHVDAGQTAKGVFSGFEARSKSGFRGHTSLDMNFDGQVTNITKGHRLTGVKNFERQTKLIYSRKDVTSPANKFKLSKYDDTVYKYHWKTGKYEGMVKQRKYYEKATQNYYMTFRRVSTKSDPMSWYHPGFPKLGIMVALGNYIDGQIKIRLPQIIAKLGTGEI